jgi:hypothetical protein
MVLSKNEKKWCDLVFNGFLENLLIISKCLIKTEFTIVFSASNNLLPHINIRQNACYMWYWTTVFLYIWCVQGSEIIVVTSIGIWIFLEFYKFVSRLFDALKTMVNSVLIKHFEIIKRFSKKPMKTKTHNFF